MRQHRHELLGSRVGLRRAPRLSRTLFLFLAANSLFELALNSHLFGSFFQSATFLLFLIFLLPLGLLKTPPFIEFGRLKFNLKYKTFRLINAGAAALGLRPKISCSRVLAPRQRRLSAVTLLCVHQGCVEAAPSRCRDATLRPC